MEKNKTTVRIAGREYTLSSPDSEEHMHRVAGYVDRKMEELTLSTRMPSNMVAVLAAMNVADELLKSQDESVHLRKEMMALQQQIAKLRAQGAAARQAGKPKSVGNKVESKVESKVGSETEGKTESKTEGKIESKVAGRAPKSGGAG